MHNLLNAVSTNPVLKGILPHLPDKTYLVGGCVRDLVLGSSPADFDLVTFGQSMVLAQRLAESLGGKAFFMDRERQVARVALKRGDMTIDVSPPRGDDIEADLAERDITINAMAISPFDGSIIDPLGGLKDLDEKRIRLIGEKNLKDDPLRGLRCLRFSAQLGFSVESSTVEAIRRNAQGLALISPERIKSEVLKALNCDVCSSFFRLMADAGYARVLFRGLRDDGMLHDGLELFSGVERLCLGAPAYLEGITGTLCEELEHGLTRSGALRMAGLFAGMAGALQDRYDDSLVRSWSMRLALSSLAVRVIAKSITGMLQARSLSAGPGPGCSGMHRLFSSNTQCIPEMLLLALAAEELGENRITGRTGQPSYQTRASSLWKYFLNTYREHAANPLLTGYDIMEDLSVEPGPKVGEMLRMVEEARSDGIVSSREQALGYLRSKIPT